jgi:hypothetical protein
VVAEISKILDPPKSTPDASSRHSRRQLLQRGEPQRQNKRVQSSVSVRRGKPSSSTGSLRVHSPLRRENASCGLVHRNALAPQRTGSP